MLLLSTCLHPLLSSSWVNYCCTCCTKWDTECVYMDINMPFMRLIPVIIIVRVWCLQEHREFGSFIFPIYVKNHNNLDADYCSIFARALGRLQNKNKLAMEDESNWKCLILHCKFTTSLLISYGWDPQYDIITILRSRYDIIAMCWVLRYNILWFKSRRLI